MLENSSLHQAIIKWVELTGVPLPVDGRWSGTNHTWHIKKKYDELKEAIELDPSLTTGVLIMRKIMAEYASGVTIDAGTMLKDPSAFMAKIAAIKEINDLLDMVEVNDAEEHFITELRKSLTQYGAMDREDVQKLLSDRFEMARLRRDALKSMEKLRLDQFLRGDHEPDEVRPTYVPVVHQWWNVNSLLSSMTAMPSGISLNLIRDNENAYESYFIFAIRNGGNLLTLADMSQYSNPLQSQTTRRPERRLEDRMERNWFPYELLGIEADEDGRLTIKRTSDVTSIAVYQGETLPLRKINSLGAYELVWITLMFDLIINKFWVTKAEAPQLSYTGEMLVVRDALTADAQAAGLPVVMNNAQLELSPLTVTDILDPNISEEAVGKRGHDPNQWLVDRYRDTIPPEMLNVVAEGGLTPVLLNDGTLTDEKTLGYGTFGRNDSFGWNWEKAVKGSGARMVLQQMPTGRIATQQEMENDRIFLARYNVARHINSQAQREYKSREKEILEWYLKAAQKNLQAILGFVQPEDIWLEVPEGYIPPSHRTTYHNGEKRGFAFMRWVDLSEKSDYGSPRYHGQLLTSRIDRFHSKYYCAMTGAQASYMACFDPVSPGGIAAIAGCKVEDIPDVLIHTRENDYIGNSILDRIDPFNSHIDNPWNKLDLRLRIPLSKRGLKQAMAIPRTPLPLPILVRGEGSNYTMTVKLGG